MILVFFGKRTLFEEKRHDLFESLYILPAFLRKLKIFLKLLSIKRISQSLDSKLLKKILHIACLNRFLFFNILHCF